MTPQQLKTYALSLPGAAADVKWGQDLCFVVADKMFAVTSTALDETSGVSFKVDDEDFLVITERDGVEPAPYMARHRWVRVFPLDSLTDDEMKQAIARSHQLVVAKLSKKKQREVLG